MSSPPPAGRSGGRAILWGILALCGLAIVAYWPVLHGGFVWDDDTFLTRNPLIRASDGLRRFWCTTQAPDYWPVTSTSLWLEWRCWGLNPAGYHATNLGLHLASVLLLWAVLARLNVRGAWCAAAVFAVHPVNVESVAWITQRKNLLALFFLLLSVLAFLRDETGRADAPADSAGTKRRPGSRWHVLSLLAFILGMLSKGSIAPLPLVLAGIVAWRRRLTRTDWLRLTPFALVSVALTAVNIWFQHHHSAEIIRPAGSVERLLEAGAIAWFYLAKAVWPVRLSFCYPQWSLPPMAAASWLPSLAALLGLAALTLARGRGRRAALAGLGVFLAMLIPVLGLTDVYFMHYSLVADHYQHLAIIGVIGLAAAGWDRWRTSAGNPLPVIAAGAVLLLFAAVTWRQGGIYRDRETLFSAILRENPSSWMAYNNLGTLRQEQGQTREAIADYRRALAIDPGLAEVHFNLANSLADSGRVSEAMSDYREAIRLRPAFPEAYYCEGLVLARGGDLAGAIADYEKALQIRANFPEAETSLGTALGATGHPAEAIGHFRAALALRPDLPELRNDWGNFLLGQGRTEEAAAQFRLALQFRPGFAQAHYNLGVALSRSVKPGEAAVEFERALALQPNYPEAENNLGAVLAIAGRNAEAVQHYRKALELRPDYAEARYNLELAEKAELKPSGAPAR